jgi:DNA-binding PadR family transcriptional regulator
MTSRLSTTGYAVLGMLALRPHTPYELTQQMQRSLDYCWPTSERTLYDQPERLVAAGLATTVPDDDPTRRRYTATPAGRAALREWLARPAGMPRFQNEPLLRVLLADQGELGDLRRVLADLRSHVASRREAGLAQMRPYLDGDGLFQDRAHIVVVVADLITRLLDALDDWASDTEALVEDWDDTVDLGLTPAVRSVLERLVATDLEPLDHEDHAGVDSTAPTAERDVR